MFSTNIIFFTTEGKGYQTGIPQGRDAAKIFFWNCSILTFQQNEAIFESILDAQEATMYWINGSAYGSWTSLTQVRIPGRTNAFSLPSSIRKKQAMIMVFRFQSCGC